MIDKSEAPAAARQIATGFSLGTPRLLVAAAQAAMGRVWQLDSSSGTFAVKESLWPDDPKSLQTQLEFSAQVCDRADHAGIRVPRVRRTTDGSLLLPVYGTHGGSRPSCGWRHGSRARSGIPRSPARRQPTGSDRPSPSSSACRIHRHRRRNRGSAPGSPNRPAKTTGNHWYSAGTVNRPPGHQPWPAR